MCLKYSKIIGVILFSLFFLIQPAKANDLSINAYFFYGDGCPHCARERDFLFGELQVEYPNLKIYEYEIYNNYENTVLLQKIANELDVRVDGVPFLVIGDKHFIGYGNGLTSESIRERVAFCITNNCFDSVASIVGIKSEEIKDIEAISEPIINTTDNTIIEKEIENEIVLENIIPESDGQVKEDNNSNLTYVESVNQKTEKDKMIKLPILGEINVMSFSLPFLTVIMGALDGFNPCALWTLLFLISLLLGIENKKRMWFLGTTFIIASASVYFLFMAAWLNLILFIGFVMWVRLLIGGIAFLGGSYNLKEFLFNKDSGCKVTNDEKRQRVFARLKQIAQQKSFLIAFVGIIILAFAVNLVELVCSAGLPAVYTQILALNNLVGWQYYAYILLYILFFMIDDLFIFFVAMVTLQMTGISTKYSRISKLIGGLLMVIIGILLIFKPEWLMFG